ncbi:hypothetical protein T440DRAFT_552465 [Plenodomus tracheiphilus IPT5]|uniref:Uncharacterized protein n=1 Tax=Plenodomus tracheiphilus IPT5 TaxID=1408161 RepID=A0A6A7BER8_9PLEO|nr:hypothetical protein T440DRAFT_552465 [Plenodomus tracheiphilus IPT5]
MTALDKKVGPVPCKIDIYLFDNIEASDGSGQRSKKKAVDFNVSGENIPEEYRKGLQTAFIDQIADTYMIATGGKNCYLFDRKLTICLFCSGLCLPQTPRGQPLGRRGRVLKWCNAPESVRVVLNDGEGKEIAYMKVSIKFQGTTEQGVFDCINVTDAVDKNARENRQGLVKTAMSTEQVDVVVGCLSKEVTSSCPNAECKCQLGSCLT